jgi:hypothetical protein
LNARGVKSYILDLSYQVGIKGINIGADAADVIIEPEAKKVWRDDEYKVTFSRHYSPESFAERIYSRIPDDMEGKILFFKNLDEIMNHYPGQRIYCFFMLLCEKKKDTQKK